MSSEKWFVLINPSDDIREKRASFGNKLQNVLFELALPKGVVVGAPSLS